MANYQVYGPFEIPRTRAQGMVDGNQIGDFWEKIDEKEPGLRQAKGCYLFAIKAARGIKPWYVGMTDAPRGFQGEVFQYHKLQHYNEVVSEQGAGTPIMFFVARRTAADRAFANHDQFASPLERLLIMYALRANDKLKNTRDATFFRNASIPGLLNPGKGRAPPSARKLLEALNRRTRKTRNKDLIVPSSTTHENEPEIAEELLVHESSEDLVPTTQALNWRHALIFIFGSLAGALVTVAITDGHFVRLINHFLA